MQPEVVWYLKGKLDNRKKKNQTNKNTEVDLEVKEANYQMVNKIEKSLEKLNNRQLQILCIWNSKCEQISWITKGFSKDLKEYLNSLNIGLHKEFDLTFNFDKLFYQRKDMRPNKHKWCESTMRAIHNWATVLEYI